MNTGCGWEYSWRKTISEINISLLLFWLAHLCFFSFSFSACLNEMNKNYYFSVPKSSCHKFFVKNIWKFLMDFHGNEKWPQSVDCFYSSKLTCDTHVSSPVTILLRNLSPFLCRASKSRADPILFILRSSFRGLGTYRAQNFRNLSFWDTISYTTVCDIWSKHSERSVIVYR